MTRRVAKRVALAWRATSHGRETVMPMMGACDAARRNAHFADVPPPVDTHRGLDKEVPIGRPCL